MMKWTTVILLIEIAITFLSVVSCCWPWDPCPLKLFPAITCENNATRECESRSDCKFTQNCCETDCYGSKCFWPDFVRGCPKWPNTKRTKRESLCPDPYPYDKCSSNEDCKGRKNCCPGACYGLHCVAPKTKKGKCVKWPYETAYCLCQDPMSCGDDSDCEGSKKCCTTLCQGSACQDTDCSMDGELCQCRPKSQCKGTHKKCKKGKKKCRAKGDVCCCRKSHFPKKCNK